MKRGNMGRGRGRGGGTGGPLMTDHLKIRNLDRELELLRRKREVIQREQHLLSMQCDYDRKRQYDNERPRNNPDAYGNVWQSSPPKRFNPQRKPWRDAEPNYPRPLMGPNTTNPDNIPPLLSKKVEMPRQMLPFNQGITPLTKPVIHPMLKKTITVRKDFNPTKVLKNRPFLPNKLNSYPVEQRKNLIAKATGAEGSPKAELPILREDQIPTQQMTGRLELALGSLVKELRYKNAENTEFKTLIATTGPLRIVKQAIRERIRSVMLNQPVGSPADIIQRYRMKYNKERDREIVDLVLKAKNSKPMNLVESDDPEEFFKTNINPIIEKKLEEMFSNLQKMYTNARRKAKLSYTKAAKEANMIDKPLERETDFDEKKRADVAQKVLRTITGKQITVEERDALNHYYGDLIANILEEKITQLLPNYIKYCKKILDMDHEYRTVKFMAVKRVRDGTKVQKGTLKATENAEGKETEDMEQSQEEAIDENEIDTSDLKDAEEDEANEVDEMYDPEEPTEMDNEVSDTQQSQEKEMKEIDKENTNTGELQEEINETDKVSNIQMHESHEEETKMDSESGDKEKAAAEEKPAKEIPAKEKPAKEIPAKEKPAKEIPAKEKPAEEKPAEDKTSNAVEAEQKQNTPAKQTPTKIAVSPAVPKTPIIPSTPSGKELPYYVKLIGRPNLPTRAVICDFLNKYRPKTIKKHKSISNLLVVGFVNSEDYEKILEANETVIGDITIIIKASEPVNPMGNDAQKPEVSDVKKEVKDTAPPSGNGLDDQINNLLSTIRKADEATAETPTNGKVDENKQSIEITDTEAKENTESKETRQCETITEVDENGDLQDSDKTEKGPKGPKESGRATPVRASSRLANVTPSTIRTRRASRLLQEQ